LKSRSLRRRMGRAEIMPTALEREEIARRQEQEVQDEQTLDFHTRQERQHDKYLSQFPEGHEPLEHTLDVYAAALGLPRTPVQYDPLPEDDGTAMKSVLERFKAKIEGPKTPPNKTKH
jgi:hypothetical protein